MSTTWETCPECRSAGMVHATQAELESDQIGTWRRECQQFNRMDRGHLMGSATGARKVAARPVITVARLSERRPSHE